MTQGEGIKVITLREAEWGWTKIGNVLNIDRRTWQKVTKPILNLEYISLLILDLSMGTRDRNTFKSPQDRQLSSSRRSREAKA